MKSVRKIIKINEELCDGCGLCVPDCAEGSLQIIDGKARLVEDKLCDGLGACLGSCPTGAPQIIEREADEFDEEAVEEFLENLKKQASSTPVKPSGCPSAQIKTFAPLSPCQTANKPSLKTAGGPSALRHWPIQIRLIPPTAPFLQRADVVVAADCSAVTAANFQGDFLQDKVVMMGCPKFDDAQSYVDKFTAIFDQCKLKSLTILIMEVPCCGSMNGIIKEALKRSNTTVPVEQITLSVRGEVVARNQW